LTDVQALWLLVHRHKREIREVEIIGDTGSHYLIANWVDGKRTGERKFDHIGKRFFHSEVQALRELMRGVELEADGAEARLAALNAELATIRARITALCEKRQTE
jgi:hypothetical protein